MDTMMKQAELEQIHANIQKLMSEKNKFNAEVYKITKENFWYPLAVMNGLFLSGMAFMAILIKVIPLFINL